MRGTLLANMAVSAALLLPLLGAVSSAGSPKHILFLMIDDLGYNDVSYRNTSDLSSPNIDALALGGIRLERYYTHNLCSPSRTSFLSGRYASTLGMDGCVIVNGHAIDLPAEVDTVADRLGKGGFKSAAFGKCTSRPSGSLLTDRCRGASADATPDPENAAFARFCTENDRVTKTGSGQT